MVNRLLLLNGVAIVNVILFHATGFGFTAMFSWAHRYRPVDSPNYDEIGTTAYYALRLVEQYAAFTIPAFLFVSGFFVSVLAGRHGGGINSRTVGARVRALAVPYLFWSVAFLTALALEGRVYSGGRYIRMILTGATHPNYYYVPLLMQMYFLAPAVVWAARRRWRTLLIVTGLLQVSVYLLQYPVVLNVDHHLVRQLASMFPKWVFTSYLFWFSLGVAAGFEQQAFKAFVHRWRWGLAVASAALFAAGIVEWEALLSLSGGPWAEHRHTLIDGLYAGTVILGFLGFSDLRLPYANALASMGAKSFGIYLSHGIFMEYAARGVYHVIPVILGQQAVFFGLMIGIGLGAPLLVMNLMSRSRARVFYPYVFG